jgi:hypothetical protein
MVKEELKYCLQRQEREKMRKKSIEVNYTPGVRIEVDEIRVEGKGPEEIQ